MADAGGRVPAVPAIPPLRSRRLAAPVAVAAAVTAGLYVFGTQHAPDYGTSLFGKIGVDTLPLKSWLGTALLGLAGLQLLLALWMYGRIPRLAALRAVAGGHRLVGISAFLLSLPIAYHCALAYGVQTDVETRVAVHSLAGCFFYGAFAAKVTIVRSRGLPAVALPIAGGLTFAILVAAWYTSGLWFIRHNGFPSL
jgi:Family of unknown function (DUF6529)